MRRQRSNPRVTLGRRIIDALYAGARLPDYEALVQAESIFIEE